MPDLINRYLSQVLTIDQIETITNKFLDGDFNNFSNINNAALKQILDKAKLPLDTVYAGVPYTQSISEHSNIQLDGLLDGQILKWFSADQKWKNVTPATEALGDVTGAENLSGTGATIFNSEESGVLKFNVIRSMSEFLEIINSGNEIQLSIPEGSTTLKGVLQLNDNGGTDAGMAINGGDSRLTNARNPNAHATSHKLNGSDLLKLDELGAPTDNTNLNVSVDAHGLTKKLTGNVSDVYRGDGTWGSISAGLSTYKTKNVTSLTWASSTGLQNVLQYSFAANEMGIDKIYEIIVEGNYLNDSGSSPKLQTKISFDTTVLWDHTIGTISASSSRRVYRLAGKFHNKGVHNSQSFVGDISLGDSSAPTSGMGRANDDEMTGKNNIAGASAIATNALSKVLKVEMAHDTNDSQISFTRTLSYIREIV